MVDFWERGSWVRLLTESRPAKFCATHTSISLACALLHAAPQATLSHPPSAQDRADRKKLRPVGDLIVVMIWRQERGTRLRDPRASNHKFLAWEGTFSSSPIALTKTTELWVLLGGLSRAEQNRRGGRRVGRAARSPHDLQGLVEPRGTRRDGRRRGATAGDGLAARQGHDGRGWTPPSWASLPGAADALAGAGAGSAP